MKKILISQNVPGNVAPYEALGEKYGVEFDFRPFYVIEPLSSAEFRSQHIELSSFTAVVFSSRFAIDAYFKLCGEYRFKVPETMKYFCTTELVANYLQKYVVYRKRKIFFGDGTPESVAELVTPRHSSEKFLIATSDLSNGLQYANLLEAKNCECKVGVLIKPVFQDLSQICLDSYEMIVLYNANDVLSLKASFPDFKQGSIKFLAYGKGIVKAMEESGLTACMQAPTPEIPSVVKALGLYLSQQ